MWRPLKGVEMRLRGSKEWERRFKLREARLKVKRYVDGCLRVKREYERRLLEAERLGDRALMRRFAARIMSLEDQVRKANALMLMLSDLELTRERLGLHRELIEAVKGFVKDAERLDVSPKELEELERGLAMAGARAEKLDAAISDLVDVINERLLSSEEVDEAAVREALEKARASEGAEREVEELDRRIEEGLRRLREGG